MTKRKPKTVKPSEIVTVDPNEISVQMMMFVNHYIICMNGTEAARLAQYSGDDATLAATASRLLRNDKVLREIDHRLSSFTMSANEILAHITDIARY
jgi:phage terminase small subunit